MTGFGRFMYVTCWILAVLLVGAIAFNLWQRDGWGVFSNCVVLALNAANLYAIPHLWRKQPK